MFVHFFFFREEARTTRHPVYRGRCHPRGNPPVVADHHHVPRLVARDSDSRAGQAAGHHLWSACALFLCLVSAFQNVPPPPSFSSPPWTLFRSFF